MPDYTITLTDDAVLADLAHACKKSGKDEATYLTDAATDHLRSFRDERTVAEAKSIVDAVKADPTAKGSDILAAVEAAKAEPVIK